MKKIMAGFLCFLMLFNLGIAAAVGNENADYIQNLIQLGIVDAEDVSADENLTYTECFNCILRAFGSNAVSDLEYS